MALPTLTNVLTSWDKLIVTGMTPELTNILSEKLSNDDEVLPVEIREESQTELFPREKLVYLSPDSRNDLTRFDDDDIYVIGGIADKGSDRAPLTLGMEKDS